ncbi:uncharacterized protein LOC100264566 isoform X2 [Vitis vinifera]|uniref:uncharacterized protein LOC100264566 isoform X2 n=1 Tax=Vitis vinifera TaxID=29760 RepID=UPI0008FFC5F0|nr:uncharacterized protein LOC100264566 isoform X2 [Vitis vinifera]|eukprot:XP_019076410.1 PREDICTED: UBX domain-containing protein 1 isoform X2 [Vitis vinifera]
MPKSKYQNPWRERSKAEAIGWGVLQRINHTMVIRFLKCSTTSPISKTHLPFFSSLLLVASQEEMAVPEVNKEFLGELEAMGFPVARATRALHFSGNDSLAAAVSWIIDHENDPDIDQMPSISEEMKKKAQELRNRARRRQEEEEKKREREREKNRIRAGKELLEAKRIDEENERKRMLAYWESEKEEQKRAREKLLKKLMEDKAERRSKLGLPPENPASVKTSLPVVLEKNSLFTKLDTKAEPLRECLRFLKKSHKNDDARVKRAFQTLLIYIRNVAKHPDEEKFRKIRFSNPAFQERVGSLTGGIEFLELCGFERTEDGEFLFLPQEKVDMAVLNSAGSVLNSAMTNPFFGVFSS